MDRKHKAFLKLNVMSLFFIAISSISVTLAWFAYSGIANVSTEIDVKSWLIEFEKGAEPVSNNMVVSLSEIYPGMQTVHETVKIKNRGDSDAQLSYSITSARILDQKIQIDGVDQDFLKDKLSHEYPFSVNMSLKDNFVLAQGEESEFDLSISWPLDSDNDEKDSEWGNLAYQFGLDEQDKHNADNNYKVRPSIKIIISVKAEQILTADESSDVNYPLGKLILYNIEDNERCYQIGGNCIITNVIDVNNTVGDKTVSLLPDILATYEKGAYDDYDTLLEKTVTGWNVETRPLVVDDLLKIVSKDVKNSFIVRDNIPEDIQKALSVREKLSDSIIGYVNYGERIDDIINKTKKYNGYYSFLNDKYNYLVTNRCYWINNEYDYWINEEYYNTKAFAITKIDENISKIYGEDKSSECSVIPVIIAPKPKENVIE